MVAQSSNGDFLFASYIMKHIGWIAFFLCIILSVPSLSFSQTVAQKPDKSDKAADEPQKPELLVDQWFIRLNALDDWFISMDGQEETSAVVDRFVELYGPDAFHQVQPSENQVGPVVFHGHDGIRTWASDFAKKYVRLAYRVDFMTRKEKPAQLFYSIQPPWSGIAAAVEFSAVYTNRKDRKRFLVPGAAFFLFDAAGKIQRVRLYLLKDEAAEIEP